MILEIFQIPFPQELSYQNLAQYPGKNEDIPNRHMGPSLRLLDCCDSGSREIRIPIPTPGNDGSAVGRTAPCPPYLGALT